MAKRRMFSLDVVDTDRFLELPASSQSLYFHLGMRADDDGFVSSPKKITSMVNCSNDDLKLLIAKEFLLPFESGVVVVTDWKVNNYIQKDRYNETQYTDEKRLLDVKDNGKYILKKAMDTECIQNVHKEDTQVRLGKESIDKNIYTSDSDEYRLAEYLYKHILKNNLKAKEPSFQKWAKQFDYILRIDKRDLEEVKEVIKFSQKDSFWMSNILSPSKLREKYDALYMRMLGLKKKEGGQSIGNDKSELSIEERRRSMF